MTLAQAVELWRGGREQDARRLCESLAIHDDSDALSLLAEIDEAARRPEQAVISLERLVRLRPSDASAHRRLGNARLASGAVAEAAESYRTSLRIEPDNVRALNNLGQALARMGQVPEAISCYERALAIDPRHATAHNNLGVALAAQGAHEPAVASYRRAIELIPSFMEAHFNCGNALRELGRLEEALECYDRALALRAFPEALLARANVLQSLDRYAEAIASYERLLSIVPDHVVALNNCASALLELDRPEEALALSERALALRPEFAAAHSNRGGALCLLHRYAESVDACERARAQGPENARVLSNLARALRALGRMREAIGCCDRALALEPNRVQAHLQRAACLRDAGEPALAAESYARVLELEPDRPFVLGALLEARSYCGDWTDHEAHVERVAQGVREGRPVAHPLTWLVFSSSPAEQRRCAQIFVENQLPTMPVDLPARAGAHHALSVSHDARSVSHHSRLRIAYLSADFHVHATGHVMARLFEVHDRDRFETIAISYGPDDGSEMRQRLKRAFERFIDVRSMSDADVARVLRSLAIDIAVDLKGHTKDARPGILAPRPAPVQVSYMGYPGTTALPHIDYLIADATVIPPEDRTHYSECVIHLPECYWVNDSTRPIATHTPSREELGLPANGFVFCCFNSTHKITPAMFDRWMGILRRVPGSVLWLLRDNAAAPDNLRREAARRGVDPRRLVYAPRIRSEEHLARQRCADLGLDTLPYNAHTTACDALWAGVPVLTCLGRTFPGRVGASLLSAIGLPELVTRSLDEFVERAVALATHREELARLRARLADHRTTHPLFDTERFCRHMEAAYDMMWQRHVHGLPPESFAVPRLETRDHALEEFKSPVTER